jgi:hypoxanthine phosphoribosyltransferase
MDDNLEVVFTEEQVDNAILLLAKQIIDKSKGHPITLVIVLKGGVFLGFRLLYYLQHCRQFNDIVYGFVGYSAYKEGRVGLDVEKTYPMDLSANMIKDRDVWIIDDVSERGLTLHEVSMDIECIGPGLYRSLNFITLIDKPSSTKVLFNNFIFGLLYEKDDFLVGCGMGDGEKYRNLYCVCKVKK